jgi:thiamine-phosphate pyrophosphorylase
MGIEVREKDMSARDLANLVRIVLERVRHLRVPVMVNERLDVALATGADGVHLPAAGIPAREVRRVFPGLIGVSTHSIDEIVALDPEHADFATFGPVFDTPSKQSYGPPKGIEALASAVRAARIPILALGGIGPGNAGSLGRTGISGMAAISSILAADDPVTSVMMLLLGAMED